MQVFDKVVYTFDKDQAPLGRAGDGEVLLFKTQDCFGCQVTSEDQVLSDVDLTQVNPATGPVYIEGAQPGDVLVVDILDIQVEDHGYAMSMGGVGPLADSIQARTRRIDIKDGFASFNDVSFPIDPMIGVIGTAPAGDPMASGLSFDHGGNMDSKKIKKGSRVYLPVWVEGGLLQMGDLHAHMGDGELSGTGIEISGQVLVQVHLLKDFDLRLPLTETQDFWYVNATEKDYLASLDKGVREMARLAQDALGWDISDVNIFLSIQGSVEINQATPGMVPMINLRIGLPKLAGKKPLVPFNK
ncbi:MAG: acetamidase/formamidase family protein [Tissierellia bacterium]|nr:acetamidase/formamidase family protein [Tissierellia bacterium]